MTIIKKIIIWLFERIAFDYWVDIQQQNERQKIKKDNNLNDNEIEEFLIDKLNRPLNEAYQQGLNDGYNKAIERI